MADTANVEIIVVDADAVEPIERRRHERINIYLKARWEGLLGCHEGTLSDISTGGCFILSESPATLRELIRLEIELHTGEWVRVWGEVTNQFAGVGFGVRYTEFEEEEEESTFALSLEQTKSIKAGVEALKSVDAAFLEAEGGGVCAPQMARHEYKARLLLALPTVNKTLLDLPECQKKTAFRLCVQAYADVYRVWGASACGTVANPKEWLEAYRCLKDKYEAPTDTTEAMRRGDTASVLVFLRQKARIYLTFAS
ncbi:MAG: PilZ domain-containing protein [Acidobacteria bacterium]|nr:PilZ domain-containing protein [Acidobacteriota bacterium]